MSKQYRLSCGCLIDGNRDAFISQCDEHGESWRRLHKQARIDLLALRGVQMIDECDCGELEAT